MQAYEFYAKPENGMIKIPDKYKKQITTEIQVILLEKKQWQFDREEANARRRTDLISQPFLNTSGWKFDKEDANER